MKMIKVFIALCAMAVFLVTNAYTQEESSEIILGCETSLLTAPVWVAENKGYFEEEGLDVKIKGFDSGKASFASMLNNKDSDICTVAQTPIMFNSFHRTDFAIIAAMVYSDKVIFPRKSGHNEERMVS